MLADVWARVVTPTCGVRIQCISRGASSPAPTARIPSPASPQVSPRAARPDNADGVPRSLAFRAVAIAVILAPLSGASAGSHAADGGIDRAPVWLPPTGMVRLVEAYAAPSDRYSRGHRGVDLAADAGAVLRAPASGVVAFAGKVVDRVVITIDHGGGYVSTLEPVDEPLPVGSSVRRGDRVARAGTGGHTSPGAVHFGIRFGGEYVNPLLMIGGGVRAVLLPCC